jgi:hypothetical protein
MTGDIHVETTRRFRRQLEWGVLTTLAWRPLTASLLLYGSLLLGARLIGWWHAGVASAGLVVVLPALAWIWHRWRRFKLTDAQMLALMDYHNRGGGLWMAQDRLDPAVWHRYRPRLQAPQVSVRSVRPGLLLLGSLFYVAAAAIVPQREAPLLVQRPLELKQLVQELKAEADALQQADLVDPSQMETIRNALETVEDLASGKDPLKAWDTLDQAKESLAQAADQQAEKALKALQDAAQTESLAEAIQTAMRDAGGSGAGGMTGMAGMAELRGALADLAMEATRSGLPAWSNSAAHLDASTLSPTEMAELLNQLQEYRGAIQANLRSLSRCTSLNPALRSGCAKSGLCSNASAAKAELAACLGGDSTGTPVGSLTCTSGRPGSGGNSRGRGDAALSWTEGSSEANAGFKAEALNPAARSDQQSGVKLGTTFAAPEIKPGEKSTGAAWQGAGNNGGEGRPVRVYPQHRASVGRYFQREDKP